MNKSKNAGKDHGAKTKSTLEKDVPKKGEGEPHLKHVQEKLKNLHEELAVYIVELKKLHGIHKEANQLNATDHMSQETLDHALEQMDAICKKVASHELTYKDIKKDRDLVHRDFEIVQEGALMAFKLCRMRRIEIPESLESKLEEFHAKVADLKHL